MEQDQLLAHMSHFLPAAAASTQHLAVQALPDLAAAAQQFSLAQQAGPPAEDGAD